MTDERGDELMYSGVKISEVVESGKGIGGVIALLWFQVNHNCKKYGLIFSFYCVFMTMKFWSWVKKRNKSGHDQQRGPTFVASPAAQCFEERSPLSELRRTKCQNLAPVVFSLQHP